MHVTAVFALTGRIPVCIHIDCEWRQSINRARSPSPLHTVHIVRVHWTCIIELSVSVGHTQYIYIYPWEGRIIKEPDGGTGGCVIVIVLPLLKSAKPLWYIC